MNTAPKGAASQTDKEDVCRELGQPLLTPSNQPAQGPNRIASHTKAETLRRLRVGDLRRIYRHRYGAVLPDDDAGRDDLTLILFSISLSPKAAAEKMRHEVEVNAPWMPATHAGQLIDLILKMPACERELSGRQLGERLRLTNCEREWLKAWRIAPVDMTAAQLAEQRKGKKLARDRARRRQAGVVTREAYLAKSLTKQKPWEAEGICRRTWERRRAERPCRKSALDNTY